MIPVKSPTLLAICELLVVEMPEDGKPIEFPFKVQEFCLANDLKLNKLKQIRDKISMMKIKYNWGQGSEYLDEIARTCDSP